jgi:hypothetical protein
MASATFVGPNGAEPRIAIREAVLALTTITAGDLLHVGQFYRARIRKRTFAGVDANGVPFAAYSGKGPYYFYPNRSSASGKTAEGRAARATAAKGRHDKTGRIGVRTATGIKYESYAAAKAAHGVTNVNLFGMEQHVHMLNTIMVKVGSYAVGPEADLLEGLGGNEGIDDAFGQREPAHNLELGFYGPESERAKGHNEGTKRLPKREFFALNASDLALGERIIAQRMQIRASSRTAGPAGVPPASTASGPITIDDVGF